MRQHGPHIAKILARQAIAEAQHLHARTGVVGFDIAGPERGNPPRLFKSAYEIARLGHLGLTAHAGEDAPADYVWQAIDVLGAQRIGHGCAAVQRPGAAAAPGARTASLVECCLSSNYNTGAVQAGRSRTRSTPSWRPACRSRSAATTRTVSRTDQMRESLRAAEQIGDDAVEAIHRAADAYSFIRPESALQDADVD